MTEPLPPTEHVEGMTPGDEATNLAAWHLSDAIAETKRAAVLVDRENTDNDDTDHD